MQQAAYVPSDDEIRHLQQLLSMPGYPVLQRIMLSICDEFQIEVTNTDPTEPSYMTLLAARHQMSLASGMYYQKLINKIAGYVVQMKEKDQPPVLPDPTEDLFD